jgi:hypothetical protein
MVSYVALEGHGSIPSLSPLVVLEESPVYYARFGFEAAPAFAEVTDHEAAPIPHNSYVPRGVMPAAT